MKYYMAIDLDGNPMEVARTQKELAKKLGITVDTVSKRCYIHRPDKRKGSLNYNIKVMEQSKTIDDHIRHEELNTHYLVAKDFNGNIIAIRDTRKELAKALGVDYSIITYIVNRKPIKAEEQKKPHKYKFNIFTYPKK